VVGEWLRHVEKEAMTLFTLVAYGRRSQEVTVLNMDSTMRAFTRYSMAGTPSGSPGRDAVTACNANGIHGECRERKSSHGM